MRKILRLHVASIAVPSAILYAIVGFFFALAAIFQHVESPTIPLGLVLPYVYLTINLHPLLLSTSFLWMVVVTLISTVCYGVTGAISGATVAIAYNLTSRFWRGIKGLSEGAAPEKATPPDYEAPPVV